MNRWIIRLLFLQILLCSLASVRGLLPGCSACGQGVRMSDFVIGMSGAVFYFHLWWLAVTRNPMEYISLLLGAAAGTHAGLMIRMTVDDMFCLWCVLAAAGGLLSTLLVFLTSRRTRRRLLVGSLAALVVVLAASFLRPSPPGEGIVNLIIYEKNDCQYCRELRDWVLPPLQHEYGDKLRVEFRPALDYEWIRLTPTIEIHYGKRTEIIEGMPSTRYLRNRISIRLFRSEARR